MGEQTWEGGFIRKGTNGKEVYIIRRWVSGKRIAVSTKRHTKRDALRELDKFEKDPFNYKPYADAPEEGIFLDADLAQEFLAHSRDQDHNTPEWVRKQKAYLDGWAQALDGADLRKLKLKDILGKLQFKDDQGKVHYVKSRGKRIAVIKRLYSWLREDKRMITSHEDPVANDLSVPQSEPAQWKIVKAATRETMIKVRSHLVGHWRDAFDVLAGTGWHATELRRFAKGGTIEESPEGEAILICPLHKMGGQNKTRVSSAVRAAAERIRERGTCSEEKLRFALHRASAAAGIKLPLLPGHFRHSIATIAINSGESKKTVADFLNHKSPRTTMRFYATHATPKKIMTPL